MSEYFRKYIKKEHYPVQTANIKFKTLFKNCVYEALKRRTWKEIDQENDWDIYWAEKEWIHEVFDNTHLAPNQKVNHFRNHFELTRKDLMIKNLKRHKKALEKEGKADEAALYNFFPLTYNLPTDYAIFFEEFKRSNANQEKSLWIMKPVGKSQGKGIFLFNKIQQISQWKSSFRYNPENPQAEPYIVQKYILDPLLIGGKKFDLRIYCLCTSFQPLTLYLYRTGFARFTHHRYDTEDISNTFVHLTNVAVQKTSENYDEKLGGKWEIQTLKIYLLSKYGQERVSECFNNIQLLIIKSIQSVQKVVINDKHCFELYGFDILLDSSLKPWLLEINASPSMTANTPHDAELKINLLDDVLTIVDVEKVLTGQEEQIGGFDLIFKGTPVKLPSNSVYGSLLGAQNNRAQQLKKMAKNAATRLAQSFQEAQTPMNSTGGKNQSVPGGINPNNPESINSKKAAVQSKTNAVVVKEMKKTQVLSKPSNKIVEKPTNNISKVPKPSKLPGKLSTATTTTSSNNQTINTVVKSSAFHQSVINNLNNMKRKGVGGSQSKSEVEIKSEECKNNGKSLKLDPKVMNKRTSAENLRKGADDNE